jgi:hypothetical protein
VKKYVNNNYTIRKIENKFYISDYNRIFEVNETAARVFSLCDGSENSTLEKIINKLSDFYNVLHEDIKFDVEKIILFLCENKIIIERRDDEKI